MKTDILTRQDIQLLVDNFYQQVTTDDVIGHYFTQVANVNWEHHLPQMYDFWESILFGRSVFTGNPMKKHFELHQRKALTNEGFNHWLELFTQNVDELFVGNNADKIKDYASIIKENLALRVIKPELISEPDEKKGNNYE